MPWTLPAPLGAFLTTGSDWHALGLVGVNLVVSVLIWLPFLRLYDKKMAEQEKAG